MDRKSLLVGAGAGLAVGAAAAYAMLSKGEPSAEAFHPLVKATIDKDGKGQVLYTEAKSVLAGGVGLLSKRPENHLPDQWPAYYKNCGPGPYVEDLDGKRYMECAYGTCYSALGFNDPDVNAAVKQAVDDGVMCTLNVPQEVELAQKLIELHPWAKDGQCRFARGGGEVNTIAVRIARAHTKRDKVAFCGYHGWADFYLAANVSKDGDTQDGIGGHQISGLQPDGVPLGLGDTMLPWTYNKIEELEAIFATHVDKKTGESEIAMIMMEPMRSDFPVPGFMKKVRDLATQHGAVLHIDEVSGGFRENIGGRHLLLDVEPDMATFAKAMSNGYAMAALVGRKEIMAAVHDTFISSSYWTEKIGPVAALATIKKMEQLDVFTHCRKIGLMVRAGWEAKAKEHGVKLTASPQVTWPGFSFGYGESDRALRTLFKQEMLKLGVLANVQFMIMYTFKEEHAREYLEAFGTTMGKLAAWLKEAAGDQAKLEAHVDGSLEYLGFARVCK